VDLPALHRAKVATPSRWSLDRVRGAPVPPTAAVPTPTDVT
jgi:hypothetical protein